MTNELLNEDEQALVTAWMNIATHQWSSSETLENAIRNLKERRKALLPKAMYTALNRCIALLEEQRPRVATKQ